ncbi:TonB-dependent receptor [Pedobacter montanisoli]|uniref:TonB-dependent receptor n=1 Tax=Pedobacter montanisoli TaxID=2923277 RepID=A0ABS9ZTH4_9SPHI|nr:TonB-dependent receptor [Pedobacter montanisoli]MCJ0741672.1 TonB-dependent receptor [Pedobacter montanisoli]
MRSVLLKIIPLFFLAFPFTLFAQQVFTISGMVTSGTEPLERVSIKISGIKQRIYTDSLGFYEVKLKAGNHVFDITAVGFKEKKQSLMVKQDQTLNFELEEDLNTLNEVVVSSRMNERKLENPQMGTEKLSMKEVRSIPLIFGERDILKAIQFLPGIKSAGEGGAGIYVRGGSSGQNLVLMDDVPVYNASHLMGFFSTFNPDAVEDITVYKTGMPAQFGGRLSSVLDVKMKQGNAEKFEVDGGIGLISSKLTLKGPIQKEKSSFIISGRRTYVDALIRLSPDSSINKNIMYFYDVNGRADFKLGERDKLIFTGYLGADKLGLAETFGLTWGNKQASLQWQHLFSSALSVNTTASYTGYQNKIAVNTGLDNVQIFSQIKDLTFKHQYFWQTSAQNQLKFGLNSIYHTVKPGQITSEGQSSYNPINYQERYSLENGIFVSDEWNISPGFNVTAGLRLSAFSILGKGDFLLVDPQGNIVDTKTYKSGQIVKTYFNLEPRLAISYLLDNDQSVKMSYVRNTQNMHLISNSTSGRPSDKWLPSSLMVKPEISDQYSAGYYRNFRDNTFEFNVESYYKTMQNQLDYRDGADTFNSDNIETQILAGKGRAYGLEFLFKKKKGKLTGWLSYTLSKTERKIEGINQGDWYNARQDRTHEFSTVVAYDPGKKWSFSASWIYYTGDAITFPAGKYNMDGRTFFYYSSRNSYRMPAYHRLDLGANYKLKQRKNFSSELSFSLYNAYGRKNAYAITFRESEKDPSVTEAVRTTLFKFVPSVSYNFKF